MHVTLCFHSHSDDSAFPHPMSTYKSFAVVGGGTVGRPFLTALLSRGPSVILLSRPGSPSKPGIPPAVEVIRVNYDDVAGVAAVFKRHRVDVLVATIGRQAMYCSKLFNSIL